MQPGIRAKVIVVPLVYNYLLQTRGSDTDYQWIELDLPQIEEWGPHLASITLHTTTGNATTNFKWNVGILWSVDGIKWNPATPQVLVADITAAQGAKIQDPFTDSDYLGLRIKLFLGARNSSGTAFENGVVTAAAAFEFKS